MPVFKVSEELTRTAKELLRIQITVLGDCPQCGGNDYRSGVCEDCAYIAPEVMEAIKEWQESQGLSPQQIQRLQQGPAQDQVGPTSGGPQGQGAPGQSTTPNKNIAPVASSVLEAFPQLTAAKRKHQDECPRCGRREFDLECRGCGFEEPPSDLNHRSPEYTGVSPDLLKSRRRKFIPTSDALERIKDQKKKVKKKTQPKKSSIVWALQEKTPAQPNFDNVTTLKTDPKPRMDDALRQVALDKFNSGLDSENSEELQ